MKNRDKLQDYIQLNTPGEVVSWVEKHYTNEQLTSFTVRKGIDSPLDDYKGSGYRRINEIIRYGYVSDSEIFDIVGLQSMLLNTYIPENIIAYRFVDIREYFILLWNTRRGYIYKYPGFLSTTLLKKFYSMEYIKNGRITIKLFVDKECHGMYLPDVVARNPEYEILFAHYTTIERVSLRQFRIRADRV